MEKLQLPLAEQHRPKARSGSQAKAFRSLVAAVLLAIGLWAYLGAVAFSDVAAPQVVPMNAAKILDKCQALHKLPAPSPNFHERTKSDRFEHGTKPVLVKNARIWTGRNDGLEVVKGDLFLAEGVIRAVGRVSEHLLNKYADITVVDAKGAWLTPGIVDVHSHLGVGSSPALEGASDVNSFKGLALPWLRSLDGLNTHDEAYKLSVSGGVTTANILPGSANAIGGQAFTIKLRPTSERTSSSLLLEPPFTLNGTEEHSWERPRWRQMKHACGENPSRVYSGTRMDTQWAFREAYNWAREFKEQQDQYCAKALAGQWRNLGPFPENLQWEALVDVLRGRVKVHNHCYEAVDLDNMVRLTQEFKFRIAAFHHAHETYLVPDLLKKAYGGPPAIALFATNARYKKEAYRGSEFAPRILTEAGLEVVMKSDHPVLDSRYLLNEAQQAHYYGLSENLAISSVTSTSATILGYDHRIGFIKPGYDADIVIWDSHPLQIGATPKQVWVDGIPQLEDPFIKPKPSQLQEAPVTPDFDAEISSTLKHDGLPPLELERVKEDVVVFTNVHSLYVRNGSDIREVFDASKNAISGYADVVVRGGEVQCNSWQDSGCVLSASASDHWIDLEGGSISPALISFGSRLALNEIDQERSTNDGRVIDLLKSGNPAILGAGTVVHAVDGLQFATRDALLAYRSGVTVGITSPTSRGFFAGLSVAFSTGSPHKLAPGAVLQDITAVHVAIDAFELSISTQIAALRHLLYGNGEGELKVVFRKVVEGQIPLVVDVQSADIMASLVQLKNEVEGHSKSPLKLTFVGANEAHLLAQEISQAGIGVILSPARPFPAVWKSRRILPGPPLTEDNAATVLLSHNVTVGLGVQEQWQSRNLRFDVGWTKLDSGGKLTTAQSIALASSNLEKLLGLSTPNTDLVAVRGSHLYDFNGKVVGIISEREKAVKLV